MLRRKIAPFYLNDEQQVAKSTANLGNFDFSLKLLDEKSFTPNH